MIDPRGYDVVVVGAGSAGCVVAARLAETSSLSVLLLEAGPDLRDRPPDGMHDGWGMYREHSWGYTAARPSDGEVVPLLRGKVVGGTSWVTRYAMRGSPADFDGWAHLGNPGWTFDDVLPFFVRAEQDLDFGEDPWHGSDGRIPVTRYPELEPTEYETAVTAAMVGNGFDLVDDHNRPGAVGFGRMPRSARDGTRVTTADAYLAVGATPRTLHVEPAAPVAAVVFDGTDAVGVRLADDTVVSAGWVVLCSGVYGSPLLLMRSGVGPADHLRELGITVRVDLPGVGENLADHPAPDIDLGYRGSFRAAPLLDFLATFHSSGADPAGPPDLGLWLSEPSGNPAEAYVDVVLLTPYSRGRVRLRSADPVQPPLIELPGLRDPRDVDRLCEGFARGLDIARSPELRRVCSDPVTPVPDSPDELRAAVRRGAGSIPHVVGTCAMGPDPDGGAVVDAQGRVHGTGRLSVIDASIIPSAPSGFPHIITIMMAERLSEAVAASL